jgi:hypothetical protein
LDIFSKYSLKITQIYSNISLSDGHLAYGTEKLDGQPKHMNNYDPSVGQWGDQFSSSVK